MISLHKIFEDTFFEFIINHGYPEGEVVVGGDGDHFIGNFTNKMVTFPLPTLHFIGYP